jgi:mono/diheme cytochrome c family protein
MNPVFVILAPVAAGLLLTASVARAEIKGEQVFSRNCTMCHVVNGKGGSIGPDLTKVSSRLSAGDIKAQFENPKKKNSASSMPAFRTLPKAEMDALMEYLKTLK